MLRTDELALLAGIFVSLMNSPARLAAEVRHEALKGEEIRLAVGRSLVLNRAEAVRRVAITNERVADVVAVSSRELLINGKAAGIASLVVWTASGDRELFTISAAANVEQLVEHIRVAFPGEPIRVLATKGVITLSGKASTRQFAEKARALAAGFDP